MHVLIAHPYVVGFAACWLLTIVLIGMPKPTTVSAVWYRWLYGSLSFATGCLLEIFHALYPKLPLPNLDGTVNPPQGRLLQMPPQQYLLPATTGPKSA